MWPLLLFFSLSALAQELDLSTIKNLEQKLPDYSQIIDAPIPGNKYDHPVKIQRFESIQKSGTAMGAINGGVRIIRIEDNKSFVVQRALYLRFYKLEDERGFKYLVNKDGSTTYKIDTRYVSPIKEELALYEPPLQYTPAPVNTITREYDEKLSLVPEANFYLGPVVGDYMQDLFNDSEARKGLTTQFGAHLATKWKLPIKVGAVIHYERTNYNLSSGGKVNFNSLSFGPQLKTKNFILLDRAFRAQMQFRVGPFANATAQLPAGDAEFKFNSTDVQGSLEMPIKNSWGEFVIGAFYQVQWLNLKDQSEIVSVTASNKTNTAIGLSLAQVFE